MALSVSSQRSQSVTERPSGLPNSANRKQDQQKVETWETLADRWNKYTNSKASEADNRAKSVAEEIFSDRQEFTITESVKSSTPNKGKILLSDKNITTEPFKGDPSNKYADPTGSKKRRVKASLTMVALNERFDSSYPQQTKEPTKNTEKKSVTFSDEREVASFAKDSILDEEQVSKIQGKIRDLNQNLEQLTFSKLEAPESIIKGLESEIKSLEDIENPKLEADKKELDQLNTYIDGEIDFINKADSNGTLVHRDEERLQPLEENYNKLDESIKYRNMVFKNLRTGITNLKTKINEQKKIYTNFEQNINKAKEAIRLKTILKTNSIWSSIFKPIVALINYVKNAHRLKVFEKLVAPITKEFISISDKKVPAHHRNRMLKIAEKLIEARKELLTEGYFTKI